MALTIEALAKAGCLRLLRLGITGLVPRRSNWLRNSALSYALSPIVCFDGFNPADQALSNRAVMCFASSQQHRDQAPFSICECMDLRVAPTSRAANSLFLLPHFPPDAERWALT
jgi:hypothetical protein